MDINGIDDVVENIHCEAWYDCLQVGDQAITTGLRAGNLSATTTAVHNTVVVSSSNHVSGTLQNIYNLNGTNVILDHQAPNTVPTGSGLVVPFYIVGTSSDQAYITPGETFLQSANGANTLFMQRTTDTSPTGNFLTFQNAAASSTLFNVGVGGTVTRYNNQTTFGLGVPSILQTLDQTGVTNANSGMAQNVLASTPAAGHYRLFYYVNESAGCVILGGAAFSISAGWTDATGNPRASATTSFTPSTGTTGSVFTQNTIDFWAASATAVTVTATYAACTALPTWTYDLHAYVEEIK